MSSFIFKEMSGSNSSLHGALQCIYLLFAQKYVLRFAEMIVCFNEKNCKLQNIFAALRIGKYLQHGRASHRSQWPGVAGREQLDDEGRVGYFHTTAYILHTYMRGMGNNCIFTKPFILLILKFSKNEKGFQCPVWAAEHRLSVPSWWRPALEPGNVQCLWLVELRMAGGEMPSQ